MIKRRHGRGEGEEERKREEKKMKMKKKNSGMDPKNNVILVKQVLMSQVMMKL